MSWLCWCHCHPLPLQTGAEAPLASGFFNILFHQTSNENNRDTSWCNCLFERDLVIMCFPKSKEYILLLEAEVVHYVLFHQPRSHFVSMLYTVPHVSNTCSHVPDQCFI